MTARLLRNLVVAVWASFFIWLLFSGAMYRYVGPRTYWVVWLGAIVLSIAVVADAALFLRGPKKHTSVGSAGLWEGTFLLIPIVILLLVPQPKLGSLAASRKATGGTVTAGSLASPSPSREVSFQEIEYASQYADYAASLGLTEGYEIELTGFVAHPDGDTETAFALTRFAIFCCAADAVPHSVTVETPEAAGYANDTWLKVAGELTQRDGKWVVKANRITRVDEPEDPYI